MNSNVNSERDQILLEQNSRNGVNLDVSGNKFYSSVRLQDPCVEKIPGIKLGDVNLP